MVVSKSNHHKQATSPTLFAEKETEGKLRGEKGLMGCEIDIDERRNEEKTKDKEGHLVSYRPPRYKYYYDFFVKLRVEHPYFDEMKFKLNSYSIETTNGQAVPEFRKPDPGLDMEYHQCEEMARDIKAAVLRTRQTARMAAQAAAMPKAAVDRKSVV